MNLASILSGNGLLEQELQSTRARSHLEEWLCPSAMGAPMDRRPAAWWQRGFDQVGKLHASYDLRVKNGSEVATLEVALSPNLAEPDVPLYRAATDANAHRWSWTTSLEAAHIFRDWRGGSVWTCEPVRIFARIDNDCHFPGWHERTQFTEWIVIPDRATLRTVRADNTRNKEN